MREEGVRGRRGEGGGMERRRGRDGRDGILGASVCKYYLV